MSGRPARMDETTGLRWNALTRGVVRPFDPVGNAGVVVSRESSAIVSPPRNAGRSQGGSRTRGSPGPASSPSLPLVAARLLGEPVVPGALRRCLACPRCSTRRRCVRMRVLAFLADPDVVQRILTHLGPPTIAPAHAAAARAPQHEPGFTPAGEVQVTHWRGCLIGLE